MFKFIGVGSAFNTDWGNNSAYMKFEDKLVLIDCGSLVFHLLKFEGVLHGVNHVYVIQTHTHGDHIGSLSGLIEYMYYKVEPLLESKVTIYMTVDNIDPVSGILEYMGIEKDMFNKKIMSFQTRWSQSIIGDSFSIRIDPHEVRHVDNLNCYGYLIKLTDRITDEKTTFYYSGDSNMIPLDILELLESGDIDYFYQDTCGAEYEGNVHLSLTELEKLIKPEYRHKVYCMHRDKAFDIHKAYDLGFNVAEIDSNWGIGIDEGE